MGFCLSRCIPDGDMAAELDAELDATNDSVADRKNGTPFYSNSLLSAEDVKCHTVIGEGPNGLTFKGSYRGSVVAVKKMKMLSIPVKQSAKEAMETALEIEATRMGSLRHPNTVLFMGACLDGDYFCVVTEYCTRGSLFNVLHTRRDSHKLSYSHKDAQNHYKAIHDDSNRQNRTKKAVKLKSALRLRLALGAARGLLYLHLADPPLVHAQLKSTNILVDDSWNAKLADFGTGRIADAVGFDPRDSCSGDVEAPSLRWTAPEILKYGEERVLRGKHMSDESCPQAVDVYSFGIILWELMTGELPFAELKSNKEIARVVLSGERPPVPSKCSIEWQELITRCWSARASRRPTAADIVSTLENFNKHESSKQQLTKIAKNVI
uniref:Protein kinase putative n=1 Tax=Albugo laibachii Nc14 TaxID=890382 RepID=F0VZM3_9STRA|nr:protein kinase putative [Albugo laibachii Nc14]|eukprot:CCA14253.1 protein kinase putative [Albugo laibachii Nc14]